MRGAVNLEQGRLRDAVADLNVAVRIESGDRRAWGLRSRAHLALGNVQRAKEAGPGPVAPSTLIARRRLCSLIGQCKVCHFIAVPDGRNLLLGGFRR
jgi:hypothetical protein